MDTVDATGGRALSRRMVSARASERLFFGASALVFAASAAATVPRCAPMSASGTRPMAGGWAMSMAWQRMPGQTWPGAAASFVGMWVVMMVAMMVPSLVPALWRYRRSIGTSDEPRAGVLTLLVGTGYFFVWAMLGCAVFPLGVAATSVAMQLPALSRAVPIVSGVAVLIAGVLQCGEWKARHLACWRASWRRELVLSPDAATAWRHGLRLGLDCCCCSASLTAMLIVLGLMDLRAMAVATIAITVERLAPNGAWAARTIGVVVAGGGLLLIARAL